VLFRKVISTISKLKRKSNSPNTIASPKTSPKSDSKKQLRTQSKSQDVTDTNVDGDRESLMWDDGAALQLADTLKKNKPQSYASAKCPPLDGSFATLGASSSTDTTDFATSPSNNSLPLDASFATLGASSSSDKTDSASSPPSKTN
jgi:hypothetical protein